MQFPITRRTAHRAQHCRFPDGIDSLGRIALGTFQRRLILSLLPLHALAHAGNTLAWREADGVQVFDVGSQRLLQTLPAGAPHGRPTLSPDGKRLAMQFEAVELWHVATGKPLLRFQETGGMGPLSFAPDGKRIAMLGESVIRVLETP